MDVRKAAEDMWEFLDKTSVPMWNDEYGTNLIREILQKIITKQVEGEKAHRWLGYVQGVVVSNGGASLEDVKQVNLKS